ncbi:ArsR/SmtB family transcription factor [Evansella halocellulosilytica]|uniref:ArsR/SmtB family transcription factor n=1 Tax=Evansella halocellulosilytica TaxID=2011013 RepID=UPI000BB68DCC|nr:winged helix-turn-helix domain-containing protein [Evansella halocellulosilytica]
MNVKSIYNPQIEFLLSALFYSNRTYTKRSDLGLNWKKDVFEQIGESLSEKLYTPEIATTMKWLDHSILFDDTNVTGTTVSELLAWLKNQKDLQTAFPKDREVQYEPVCDSNKLYTVLSYWYERYFSTIDKAILIGLKQKKEEVDRMLKRYSPVEVVDRATHGIWLENQPDDLTVYLVPQYHWRPILLYMVQEHFHYYSYSVDEITGPNQAVPSIMMRAQHALADENRLSILRLLATGPKMFKTIHQYTGLAKSTVHHHLITLRAAGLSHLIVTPGQPDRYSFREQGLTDMEGRIMSFINDSTDL